VVILSACDPANAYGAGLPWPRREGGAKPQRVAGAHVFMFDGYLLAWLSRTEKHLLCFIEPEQIADAAERERCATSLAEGLLALLHQEQGRRKAMLLEKIDDDFANQHWLAAQLCKLGFRQTHDGLLRQRDRSWERVPVEPGARPIVGVVERREGENQPSGSG
jgi:ATP-dependent Lhr-like helicase